LERHLSEIIEGTEEEEVGEVVVGEAVVEEEGDVDVVAKGGGRNTVMVEFQALGEEAAMVLGVL
jgi:hypothetical protein